MFLVLSRLGTMLVALILTPYLVYRLGFEVYGLWAVLGSIVWYFGLLDLGIGTTFVKYIAEYAARGEKQRVQQILVFGLFFYALLALLLVPLAYFAAPLIIGWFELSPSLSVTAVNVLVLVLALFFLSNALGVFTALLNGLEQMRTTSLIMLAGLVVYVTGVVTLVQLGYGIYGVVAAGWLQLAFITLASYIFARRTFGPLFTNPLRLEGETIRRLFVFGGWMQVNNVSSVINMETDRFLIGGFVNVSSVTYYEVGNKLALLTRSLPSTFLGAVLPAVSALQAAGEVGKINEAYIRISRSLALANLSLSGFVVGATEPVVKVWMGADLPYVHVVVAMLVFSYAVNMLTGAGTTVLRAVGQPRYEAYYTILSVVLNISATLMLAPVYGLMGVILGTVIGSVVSSIYFLWLFHRLRDLSWWPAMGRWLWRLVVAVVGAGAGIWALSEALPDVLLADRAVGLGALAFLGVVYICVLALLLRATRFFTSYDWHLARHVLPGPLARLLNWRPVRYLFGVSS